MTASFADLRLRPSLLATLAEEQLEVPTEIQQAVIPALLASRSVVGVAETGSGKTLAYALPLLHMLKAFEEKGAPVSTPAQPRGLIIVPTRELGEQVARVIKRYTHDTRLRVRMVLGGAGMDVARRNVSGPFELLIATPGRLTQLMEQQGINLSSARLVVLDEADQLLDMGFLPDVARIVDACSPVRQLALFSATVPKAVEALIAEVFVDPVMIRSSGHHRVVSSLTTSNRTVDPAARYELLEEVLGEEQAGASLIFVNTRQQCDDLAAQLRDAGWRCEVYRGELDRAERRTNLKRFRAGEIDLLIATDLGARGLDVDHVGRVINYHLPQTVEHYLHRTGRTARAGRPGLVVNFVTPRDQKLIRQLEHAQAPKPRRR